MTEHAYEMFSKYDDIVSVEDVMEMLHLAESPYIICLNQAESIHSELQEIRYS